MAKRQSGGDDGLLDLLYAASPKSFVEERGRVVAALKAAGRSDEARLVAKRKRPSASVWAVNQLARQAGDELAALLAMGESLRKGERALLRGGDAAGFMEEARAARQKVAALVRRAERIVEEGGQKATVTLGRKIAATLQAASIGDDETRARLEAGRIDEDLSPPSSFGGIGGAAGGEAADDGDLSTALAASLGGGKSKPKRTAHDKRADERARAADAHARAAGERKHAADERKRAAARLRAQRREQAAARKHAATLARAATAADRAVAELQGAVEKMRAAVERAEAELRAAKDELADAELAAAAAHRAAAAAAAAAR